MHTIRKNWNEAFILCAKNSAEIFANLSNLDEKSAIMKKSSNMHEFDVICKLDSLHYRLSTLFTQRNLFEILLNQPEIRLYLPLSNWFSTKRTSVWFQINRKMVNIIWFRFDLTRFRKDFSAYNSTVQDFVAYVEFCIAIGYLIFEFCWIFLKYCKYLEYFCIQDDQEIMNMKLVCLVSEFETRAQSFLCTKIKIKFNRCKICRVRFCIAFGYLISELFRRAEHFIEYFYSIFFLFDFQQM